MNQLSPFMQTTTRMNRIPTNAENIAQVTKQTEWLANVIPNLKKHLNTLQNKLIDEEIMKRKIEAEIKELSNMLDETENDLFLAKSLEQGVDNDLEMKVTDLQAQLADSADVLEDQEYVIKKIKNDINEMTANTDRCKSEKMCLDEKLEMLTKLRDGTSH